jgi:hypothetical protein
MEPVGPRPALEYEVKGRIAILAVLVTGLALPAPSAFAHGNQFVCAKMTIGDDGWLALELTADHGGNPNIADAQEARQALREAVRIRIGEETFPLEHFGALRFEDRDRYSEDSPVPPASEPGPHQLVTAFWQARLPGQRIVFAAKDHTPLDVVMWRAGEPPISERSRWILLIAGDRSPEFAMTSAAAALPGKVIASLGMLATLPFLAWGWLRRRSRVVRPTRVSS